MLVNVSAGNAAEVEADGLIVGVPEGTTTLTGAAAQIDSAAGGLLAEVLAEKRFTGKEGSVELLYPVRGPKARRVVLVGLGKDPLTAETWRQTVAAGFDALRNKARKVALVLPEGLDVATATAASAEVAVMSSYSFHPYITKPDPDEQLFETLTIINGQADAVAAAVTLGQAVTWVRDLSNMPGNKLDVPELARRAEAYAREAGLTVKRFDNDALLREGFGCLTAVGRGSVDLPVFLVVEYMGGGDAAPVVLAGKGITFDTGGVCIKPRVGMEEMKTDMHGLATVLAAMRVAVERKLPINLVGLLPIAENMPAGDAYIPGDVLKAYDGQTVEVVDTDAEGRLILADALAYGTKHYPNARAVIDVATLTGSIIMALGYEATGLFSNDDALSAALLAAGERTGERLWRMPTWSTYRESLQSDIADLRQVGKGRGGDAINAALFLQSFAGKAPWAHLDIAGPSFLSEAKHYHSKGATGVGVRMLVDWLEQDVVKR